MVKKWHLLATAIIIAALATVVVVNDQTGFLSDSISSTLPAATTTVSPTPSSNAVLPSDSVLEVIFLDVGQADCILLKTGDHVMLIDAGNTGQDQFVLNYLAEYGVTKLDYLVATHPHADHIGSMASVVKAMKSIGMAIMPDKVHTTKTFENLMNAIEEKDISITNPSVGAEFSLGDANMQVLAPKSAKYADLNDYSIVLRVEFGTTVFLFTGDADGISENEQLSQSFSLSADVLKVGHHGSRTSSSQKYLDAISPIYAVISCGTDNTYGHPHKEAMTRLMTKGVEIYRTDENGTIIFVTDGKEITVSITKESSTTSNVTLSYIGNKNSKTFHLSSCGSLPQEQNRIHFNSRQEAIDADYNACNTCKP
ncbi:MAG: MBL fold metallo-hydrolase [Nitrososphaerota archaeon]|jgi:competence protein ComEC|nr:MBL fold metallo-hydrolase [Nitrososphaerota archaeon]